MVDLKPCPFCDGKPTLHQPRGALGAWISCAQCGLEGPTETGVTGAVAIAHWNTRADPRIAALEAQLAERVMTAADTASKLRCTADIARSSSDGFTYLNEACRKLMRQAESALEATPPAPKVTECATDDCERTATVRFERGGIGSDYCRDCYMRVQALTAALEASR